MIAAALLTLAYDVVIGWMVGFTLSWGGLGDFLKPSLGAATFWIVGLSPVVVTALVVSRFRRTYGRRL
jgi:hypothetical protein